ncbi:hypothetical protein [Maribacter sp. R77961]|uniref:hypothetical protein n=1 Tax=Maribacter sp. R77961 TaxID=3093871 RepID=UPI0037C7A448
MLKQEKEKTKQKDLAMCVAESKRKFAPVLFIAKPLAVMLKKLILHIIIILSFVSCNKEETLNGHWHEYLDNSQDLDNCYIITDTTISINKFTNGATFQLDSAKPSQIWEYIQYPDSIIQSHLIKGDKVIFQNNTKWIRQISDSETFLNDFSAGYKVNILPFESTIENSDSIDFQNNKLSIILACGQIKSQYVDPSKGFFKNQFYFQINNKVTKEYGDLLEYINCTHCKLNNINLYVNMDRRTPIKLQKELDSALHFLNIKKSQVFYLNADLKRLNKGYKNTTANNTYSK